MIETLPLRDLERLLAEPIHTLEPIRQGGNNRLYRLTTPTRTLALKHHTRQADDPRDRQGTEITALTFLNAHRVAAVPRLIAHDRASGLTLLEWIDGEPIGTATPREVDQALELIAALKALNPAPDADPLPPASAACLTPRHWIQQLQHRAQRAQKNAADHPPLKAWLQHRFLPIQHWWLDHTLAILKADARVLDAPLPRANRLLSPSDFGFHNALRQRDGGLRFLDFEYFGWDDPVKLTCDFQWHPGMNLAKEGRERFVQGMMTLFDAEDTTFSQRHRLYHPLIGLCWCLILLNECDRDGWARRAFASEYASWQQACAQQRIKAEALLVTLEPPHA
ncbi:MAG: aminoglycoside phosphotransferase family protein [Magnetococcales bacterium]|nr:aminoglycoside phosphotransferase family protein [Magnetococcales bacterium]